MRTSNEEGFSVDIIIAACNIIDGELMCRVKTYEK